MSTTYYWTDDDGDHDFENPSGNNWKTAAGVSIGNGTAKTFTVATTTDVLTATSHGLVPGQAVRLTTTDTLPDGLSLLTTYYAGAIDGNDFKLYSTAAKGVAGSTDQVTIDDAGTGTHTVTPLLYPGVAAADAIIFPSYAAAAPSVSMNQASNPNGINNLTVEDGYAYGIGTRENPLYLKQAAAGTWTFKGNDHLDIWIVSGTTAVAVVRVLDCSTSYAIHLAFGTAAATLADVTAGSVVFESSLFGVTSLGVATLNTSKQVSGAQPSVTVDCPVTTALNNYGAVVDWVSGTIANLSNYDGTFRCSKSTAARTLTASTCYGGTVDFRTGVKGVLTLTAAIKFDGGSSPLWDFGESLQRS